MLRAKIKHCCNYMMSQLPRLSAALLVVACGFLAGHSEPFWITVPATALGNILSTVNSFSFCNSGWKCLGGLLDCKTVVYIANASDGEYSNERSGASVKTARKNGERR